MRYPLLLIAVFWTCSFYREEQSIPLRTNPYFRQNGPKETFMFHTIRHLPDPRRAETVDEFGGNFRFRGGSGERMDMFFGSSLRETWMVGLA